MVAPQSDMGPEDATVFAVLVGETDHEAEGRQHADQNRYQKL